MNQYKPKILLLHTISEQEKEWLKILDSPKISLNILSPDTDIVELLDTWQKSKIALPDLILLDMMVKTPDGHFIQVNSLSRWCKQNKISLHIIGLYGQQEKISNLELNMAKYLNLTDIFPKINLDNQLEIINRIEGILGITLNQVIKEKSPILPTIEEKKTEEDNQHNLTSIDIHEERREKDNYNDSRSSNNIQTDIIQETDSEDNVNDFTSKDKIQTDIIQEILDFPPLEDVWAIAPKNDIESLNEAIINNPSSANLYCERGDFYLSIGNNQEALHDYERAIKVDPKCEQAFLSHGNILVGLGDYRNGIKDLTQVLKLNPKNAIAYHNRGLALFRSGDERGAKKDYDQAIKLQSDFSQAYNDRAFLLYLLGQTNQALQDYEQAIKYHPDYADAYYNRGNIYSDLGKFKEAISDYTDAIRCNPQLALAYGNRGIAYYELDFVAEAINDTTQSANLFHEQGDLQSYQQAIDTLKQMK